MAEADETSPCDGRMDTSVVRGFIFLRAVTIGRSLQLFSE